MCKHKPSESCLRPTRPGPAKKSSLKTTIHLKEDAGRTADGSEIRLTS